MAAIHTGEPWRIPGTRHLHEYRTEFEGLPRRSPSGRGDARLGRQTVVGRLLRRRHDLRQHRWLRRDRGQPAEFDQPLDLGTSGVTEVEQCTTLLFLSQEGGIPSVNVRRQRLAVQRVAVIPHGNQSEVRRWRVHDGPIADDRESVITNTPKECAVPIGI